jgi:hypothetical protein
MYLFVGLEPAKKYLFQVIIEWRKKSQK